MRKLLLVLSMLAAGMLVSASALQAGTKAKADKDTKVEATKDKKDCPKDCNCPGCEKKAKAKDCPKDCKCPACEKKKKELSEGKAASGSDKKGDCPHAKKKKSKSPK